MAEEEIPQSEETSKKNKKINKFTIDEINQKIEDLEKSNQVGSKYYKHLQLRKKELQS
ncbi:MAG: hypothetical protein SVZ03_09605 [Spirochaetota bacterium]|nr:hypothetical protein [Spirochaetota bacterium]